MEKLYSKKEILAFAQKNAFNKSEAKEQRTPLQELAPAMFGHNVEDITSAIVIGREHPSKDGGTFWALNLQLTFNDGQVQELNLHKDSALDEDDEVDPASIVFIAKLRMGAKHPSLGFDGKVKE